MRGHLQLNELGAEKCKEDGGIGVRLAASGHCQHCGCAPSIASIFLRLEAAGPVRLLKPLPPYRLGQIGHTKNPAACQPHTSKEESAPLFRLPPPLLECTSNCRSADYFRALRLNPLPRHPSRPPRARLYMYRRRTGWPRLWPGPTHGAHARSSTVRQDKCSGGAQCPRPLQGRWSPPRRDRRAGGVGRVRATWAAAGCSTRRVRSRPRPASRRCGGPRSAPAGAGTTPS